MFFNLHLLCQTNKNFASSIFIENVEDYIFEKNKLYNVFQCHSFTEKKPQLYSKYKKDLLNAYYSTPKGDLTSLNRNIINISLHIRRGDVNKNQNSTRFTENQHYIDILNFLLPILEKYNKTYSINLYSQGEVTDFKEFEKFTIDFHLNESIFSTFHNLIHSEILILAKSSFSYLAGLYSNNIIFYEDFWHKPQSTWYVYNRLIDIHNNKIKKDFLNKISNL